MPDLDLSEGRRLLETAHLWDWRTRFDEDEREYAIDAHSDGEDGPTFGPVAFTLRPQDSELIAYALNALPALFDTAEKMQKAMAAYAAHDAVCACDGASVEVRSILQGDQQ